MVSFLLGMKKISHFVKYNLTNQYWKSNLFPQSLDTMKHTLIIDKCEPFYLNSNVFENLIRRIIMIKINKSFSKFEGSELQTPLSYSPLQLILDKYCLKIQPRSVSMELLSKSE